MGNNGPVEVINQTKNTQPLLFAYSYALYQAIREQVSDVTVMAGHSLGEYTALAASGLATPEEVLKVVAARGNLMQNAVPMGAGKMAAVLGAEFDSVQAACNLAGKQISSVCEIANINANGQIVIAGASQSIDLIVSDPAQFGLKRLRPLDVSVPSHCSLMETAGESLAKLLDDLVLADSKVSLYQNYTGERSADEGIIRTNLVAQISKPVQWVKCINNMVASGVDEFVECGPGKVLAGMLKRTVSDVSCTHAESLV